MSTGPPGMHVRQVAVAALVIALCAGAPQILAQPSPDTHTTLTGRRLEDALRVLQARGLRLVFTSQVVTPDMRVRANPRAATPKEQLAELLQPHGLTTEAGPGGILLIVREQKQGADRPDGGAGSPPRTGRKAARLERSPIEAMYRERVTVFGELDAEERGDLGIGSPRRLGSDALAAVSGHPADDPLRVVQALPGVATGDDFRSDYSVRGSRYRHAGVVIDGVVAPWLQHAALGRGDTGTMTMLRGDMVRSATLHVGAYARLDGSQIGPQLNLTLREGSRTATLFQAGVSSTGTTLTAEGPLGSAARGSWLVGVRNSHAEWPIGRSDEDSTVFGFGDLQAKVVYDVRPDHHVSLGVVAGQSNVEREPLNPFAFTDGRNRAGMVTLAWRSVIGSRAVVTQRVSTLAHEFVNNTPIARVQSGGENRAHAYRVDVSQPLLRGILDAGGHARWVRGSTHGPTTTAQAPAPAEAAAPAFIDTIGAAWLERSAHASFQRAIGPAVTVAAGLRLSDSTLVEHEVIDRWLQAEWVAGPRWIVHGSTGVMHQLPVLDQVVRRREGMTLRPERATYVDLGIGQHVSSSIRWDATVFARRERDVLRQPDGLAHARLIDGILTPGDPVSRFEPSLTGSARGVELMLARESATGPSGWIGYAYGVARSTDGGRQETFPADFDQRHAINVSGAAPLPWRSRLRLTFRGGTNFPVPGYLDARDGRLFAGPERNRVRLPAYARLDLRGERTFEQGRRRFMVFVDAINLLNRVNVGPADGVIASDTGEAVGFTERLFPRLLTAGVRVAF